MAKKYPRKSRQKIKWYDPFARKEPLAPFSKESQADPPTQLRGLSKKKNKKLAANPFEQQVPRAFKLFMKGIKMEETQNAEDDDEKLFTPSTKIPNSKKNVQKKKKPKKESEFQQWKREAKKEKEKERELDEIEKAYFKDQIKLHERVDAPPLTLKPPVATLKTPKSKSSTFSSPVLASVSKSAKKVLASVTKDGNSKSTYKTKRKASIVSVKPVGLGLSEEELIAERERVTNAYKALKWSKTKSGKLQSSQTTLTPIDI